MTSFLRAEWLKLVTTRTFYGLTVAAALLSAFVAFGLVAQGPPPWNVSGDQLAQMSGVLAISSGLFCLILGQRTFTEEIRYGTIVHTAFSDPHRTRAVVAKVVVAALGALVLTALSLLLTVAVLATMTAATGGTLGLAGTERVAVGLLGGGVLWAALGVGVAAIIRQPVPAVVTALLWVLVFENVATAFLGPFTRFLPGQAAQVMARGAELPVAGAAMAAWAAALCLIGWTTFRRRDVI